MIINPYIYGSPDTTGPTAPVVSENPIATYKNPISFVWSAAYDASGVENYYIERRINGGAWSLLTSVIDTVLSYTDTSAKTNGNTYSYRVIADDIYANMGTYSNIVDTKYDTTPPSVATTINGLEEFDGPGITINPTGGSDSFSGVLHYTIWRSTSGPTSGYEYKGTTSQVSQRWFDSNCVWDVQYWYKAETVDVAGNLSGLSSTSLFHNPSSGGK